MRKKAEPIITTEQCSYGCGNIAKFKNASQKLMCDSSSNKCSVIRAKNSNGAKDAYSSSKRPSGKDQYNKLSDDTKEKMKWNKGLTIEDSVSVQKYTTSRLESIRTGKYTPGKYGVALSPELRWKRNKFVWTDSLGNICVLESKHERHVAILLDDANVRWIRPEPLILLDGRSYEPDFYLIDYDVYLDPKSIWCKNAKANQTETGQKIIAYQTAQLEKIERCRKELSVRIVILLSSDKRSFSWQGILDMMNET